MQNAARSWIPTERRETVASVAIGLYEDYEPHLRWRYRGRRRGRNPRLAAVDRFEETAIIDELASSRREITDEGAKRLNEALLMRRIEGERRHAREQLVEPHARRQFLRDFIKFLQGQRRLTAASEALLEAHQLELY